MAIAGRKLIRYVDFFVIIMEGQETITVQLSSMVELLKILGDIIGDIKHMQ